MANEILRTDQQLIVELVAPGSRILDLGCGDGLLLETLIETKGAKGFGVEISHEGIHECIRRGVPVYHGDIDQGLFDHPDKTFDYVILSHTLQTVHRPRYVLEEMLRVGRMGIVSFPNFGYWRNRVALALGGRMPKNELLPHAWYDTPNIHMCTILDFQELCHALEIRILAQLPLSRLGQRLESGIKRRFVNLLAPNAVYLLEKKVG